MTTVRKSVITAMCIALCVVLPMAFHAIPNAGSIFLPMHIPALLCGLITSWPFGLLCGLAGPLLSSLLTGMPPSAILPSMMVELAVYGLAAALMMKYVKSGNLYADLYISLVTAMLAGRVIAGIAKALIFTPGKITLAAWVSSGFIVSWPGILIQLAIIPSLVFALEKASLIPVRYKKSA